MSFSSPSKKRKCNILQAPEPTKKRLLLPDILESFITKHVVSIITEYLKPIESIRPIRISKLSVTNSWESHFLLFAGPNLATEAANQLVTMRFCAMLHNLVCNLVCTKVKQSDESDKSDGSDSELESDENYDDDSDVQRAKVNGTYALFRDEIIRGARDVQWMLTKHLPNGEVTVIPERRYLTRMGRYENDIEMQDSEGNVFAQTRIVPDGYYSGLYREAVPVGTKFQFTLSRSKPFMIDYFRMDVFGSNAFGIA